VSRIDDLVAKLCPEGVPFVELGKLGAFIRGRRFTKEDYVDSGLGVIHYGEIYTCYGTATAVTRSFVRPELKSGLRLARTGDLVIAATGENIEDVCKAVAWMGDDEIAIHDDCYIFRHGLDPEYVSYFFQSSAFQDQKTKFVSESKVVRVSGANMAKIEMPVPPLEVQRKIARTLDTFAYLEAELGAELEGRRRQYEHYRDSLLAFAERDGVRWVIFGEAATIVRGGSPRPIQGYLTDAADGVNWIKIGDVAPGGKYITSTSEKIKPEGALKSRRVEPGDFVLSNSMSFGRPYIVKIDGYIHDGWLAIKDYAGTFLPDFLYHLLRTTRVYKEMAQRAGAGTVQNLNAEIVKRLLLPAPPLAEQERIVAILDKFDTLVNDLSIGLPAELTARRKQYEYYRDRLLTFSEAA
jgi:type I restriction enzyme, S subunit